MFVILMSVSFWTQEKVSLGVIKLFKVGSSENLADALTEYVKSEDLQNHVKGLNQFLTTSEIASEEELKESSFVIRQSWYG